MKLFRVFFVLCRFLDRYIWEPIYWVCIYLIYSGFTQIKNARKGKLYFSKKEQMFGGFYVILLGIFVIYWYWFSRFRLLSNLMRM